MSLSDFLATFDVIDPDMLIEHFNLGQHTRPFVSDMLAAQGYRRRADGWWRRAGRITLSSLSPAGGGGARTGRGGVWVEYRNRRRLQPLGKPVSIWSDQHRKMMKP